MKVLDRTEWNVFRFHGTSPAWFPFPAWMPPCGAICESQPTLRPHSPLLGLLWALRQRTRTAVQFRSASRSTWPPVFLPHRPLFRLLWALRKCEETLPLREAVFSRCCQAQTESCFGQKLQPNIALIPGLACNLLVHKALCKDGQSGAMLGWLKKSRNGSFRAVLTLPVYGLSPIIRCSTNRYIKAANQKPC